MRTSHAVLAMGLVGGLLIGGCKATVGSDTYQSCFTTGDCGNAFDSCVEIPGSGGGSARQCSHTCSFDSDCEYSGRCLSFDGGGSFFCVDDCVSDSQCTTGFSCQGVDATSNACLPGGGGIPAYDECTPGSDTCSGGLGCTSVTVDSVTAGLCTVNGCTASSCPADSRGFAGRCISFDSGGLFTCFEACAASSECAPGWACKSSLATGETFDPICLPM